MASKNALSIFPTLQCDLIYSDTVVFTRYMLMSPICQNLGSCRFYFATKSKKAAPKGHSLISAPGRSIQGHIVRTEALIR